MTLHGHEPQIPVVAARDYTREPIQDMRVEECSAEGNAYEDGLVTVSLCGTPEDISTTPDDGLSFGYEFDMTPDNAVALAQKLLNAAAKARAAA